jgi:hypothetical protein
VPAAYACNSSYSGVRDQEDHGSKPVWANSSQDPILKKPITKKGRPRVHTPVPEKMKQNKTKKPVMT